MSWNVCNWTAENKRSKRCPKALGCFIASPTRSGNDSYQGSTGCSLPKPLIAALTSPIGFTWWCSSGVLDALSCTVQTGAQLILGRVCCYCIAFCQGARSLLAPVLQTLLYLHSCTHVLQSYSHMILKKRFQSHTVVSKFLRQFLLVRVKR